MDDVFPRPIRLPGQPEPPREVHEERRHAQPEIVDEPIDAYGAEAAAADLAERLDQVRSGAPRVTDGGVDLLSPPFTPGRDRVEGPEWARPALVVFGAHGTPSSRPLGRVLAAVRTRHPATVALAWRHFPDPAAHPRASLLALAAEAAAAQGRFWALTRELLAARHHDPSDLSAVMVRAGLDPARTLDAMRAGTGADRIVADTTSALASAVVFSPALFIDGERYRGELEPAAVSAALMRHPSHAAEGRRTAPGPEGPAGPGLAAERPSNPGDTR
jgi:2-hydroxychromene-2-carboxylate isomerase